jgi:hypothetical protein
MTTRCRDSVVFGLAVALTRIKSVQALRLYTLLDFIINRVLLSFGSSLIFVKFWLGGGGSQVLQVSEALNSYFYSSR